mmetsp:Transcript_44136/g.86589  ORF Transcript_44136/g.86589 Transcript_44136/m.86589 type:complete len:253 (-) Transcript_44136:203-961(-)|eukprot:CAMPEP_0194321508 /NCGR_PEP_ID=MMETSP0171-20130528/17712_1 /TAXON_ID=218684 /ORGANISM="Corethron pennatum, Strain L29A3" /LENGTH=252 /DNA_ID=CAMNT_0039079427 /DNA_START=78 /DNA_END=836 /DNA_ORIENTATION=-
MNLYLLALVGISSAVVLDEDAFYELPQGFAVFINFCKPSLQACKDLAPAWQELGSHFPEGGKLIIAEVNCEDNSYFCEDYGVTTFPTLKYGDDLIENDYDGALDAESLKIFAPDVEIRCSVEFQHWWCNDEELELIKSYREMAPIELIEQITEMNDAVEEEYDRVAELVEEADSRLEVFQQLLEEAIVEGDEDQIQSARIHLAEAQHEVSEADAKYDVVTMKDQPLTLSLMEEIADELNLGEEFGEEYADLE